MRSPHSKPSPNRIERFRAASITKSLPTIDCSASFDRLKAAIVEYKQAEAGEAVAVRDGDIRDALIFFTQLGARYFNSRPKGRAFLDLLRSQFNSSEVAKPESNIVLLP